MTAPDSALFHALQSIVGASNVLPGATRVYLSDATETRNIRGHADAIVLPTGAEQVAAVLEWCYDHDVPLTPRGGGSGYSGGAVPTEGGVVLGMERLRDGLRIEPEAWRVHVPAGLKTSEVHRLARENGLYYPPDPGAAEQSQIGGNIATNAGGPHTFKYGVTGVWVTGLEVVLATGERTVFGGTVRKDVAGYDLKSLMIGSEGTLAVVTGASLRLIPAPEARFPVVAFYPDAATGCANLQDILACGLVPATLEYLDEPTLATSANALPAECVRRDGPAFMLIAEADGTESEAKSLRDELIEMMDGAASVYAPERPGEVNELWRWRAGVSLSVVAQRGGKASEDIVVPVERLAEAIAATREIGTRHGLRACSWGHAGDGNLHSTMMLDPDDPAELKRAEAAGQELFEMAVAMGGAVSGEHGVGLVKNGALARQWDETAVSLHEGIKHLLDPKGLLNPGKKLAR